MGRRFGPFELDLTTGELRKNGIRIQLPNQAFQLLVLLTGHAGELVNRDQIRFALWPNETVVEWEHSINTAMKRIRAALGDTTSRPIYIETLRGRGYRFLGTVEQFATTSQRPAMARVPEPVAERRAQIPIGGEVSHYRVLELIGTGGMGVVYKAEDLRLGRLVALKFLPFERVADPVALGRFEREARTASALNHPNICTIYDIEVETQGAFIAMELLEGENLRERMQRSSASFSTGSLIDLGVQIADALEAAHEHGIIHRDIKPANVFLSRRGEVKVLDFGLAKPAPRRLHSLGGVAGSISDDLTTTGGTPGTAAYMSPEQSRGEELDARTDLYSFGAVLYEMATGRRLEPDAFARVSLDRELVSRHPSKLWEIIARLLDSDRTLRYQTAGDVASELRRLKRDLSNSSSPSSTLDPDYVSRPSPPAKRGVRLIPATLLAAAVVAVAFAGWWVFAVGTRRAAISLPEILTTSPGDHVAADFSPDGKQIVYCWNGVQENNYDIYSLTIGSNQPRRLTTDSDVEYSPAWSPDGNSIAFLKGPLEGVATLMLMPASGGPARKISDTAMRVSPLYRRIEWSRNGRWIVMEDETAPEDGYGLIAVSVSTGERHELTHPGANRGDLQPAISPDGRTLAFIRDVGNGVGEVYLLSLTSEMTAAGEPRRLVLPKFENVSVSNPRWLHGGRELLFNADRGGSGRLWCVSISGQTEPVILASLGENILFPMVSRDGARLVFSRFSRDESNWTTPAVKPGGSPQRLVGSSGTDSVPDFSPDGSQIAFDSRRSGTPEIWVSDRNGGSPRQLTNYGGPGTGSTRWSPDGKWLAYDSRVEGQPDIYVIPSTGGTAERLTSDPAPDVMPIWSPDGRWIYFCSGRSGTRQVWRIPSHGGNPEQITRTGGCAPRITADGKTVFYMKRSGRISSIWNVPANGGEELLVVNNVVDRCFAVFNRRLYYVTKPPDDAHPSLRYLDLTSKKVTILPDLPDHISPTISITPDGASVVYHQVVPQGSTLMLVFVTGTSAREDAPSQTSQALRL